METRAEDESLTPSYLLLPAFAPFVLPSPWQGNGIKLTAAVEFILQLP